MKIELSDCGKSFNRKWLFRNLNCSFNSGERWAFLGANGSGKSTLCLLLIAQVWPTEGSVSWEMDGQKLEAREVFSRISLASPAMELPEEFTIPEIVALHGSAKKFAVENPVEVIAELSDFGKNILQKPLVNFSSGMKQRAKLCLAALTETPLLVLDEPLTNLDKSGASLFEKIVEDYSKNRLLVIASNREDEYKSCTKFLRILPDGSVAMNQELSGSH